MSEFAIFTSGDLTIKGRIMERERQEKPTDAKEDAASGFGSSDAFVDRHAEVTTANSAEEMRHRRVMSSAERVMQKHRSVLAALAK